MKVSNQKIALSGFEPTQHFVSVTSDTGVFASTKNFRITGVPEEDRQLIEVRKAPSKSIDPSGDSEVEAARR